ncbi:hypothetical protein [Oryzobacter telluris]|uniref:hypothetical protein n=1 Tax=Oryzobacter telluris TaxID=3149179 RepID=UPI00370D4222
MSPATPPRVEARRSRLVRPLAVLAALVTLVGLAAAPSSAADGDVTVVVNSDGTATYTSHVATALTVKRSATEGGTEVDNFALAGNATVSKPLGATTKCWAAYDVSTPVDGGCVVPAMAPNATGTYYRLPDPTRFLDTRSGSGVPLGQGGTRSVQVGGVSGIPSTGVSAIVANLTATKTSTAGYMTLYPSGVSRPTASSLNFPSGWTGANLVTVPIGADGKVVVYNDTGSAHAILDVLGWYAADDTVRGAKGIGAQFQSTVSGDPERLYDSRDDEAGAYVDGDVFVWHDEWDTSADADAVEAYALNITAVGATKAGVLSAWSGETEDPPNASSVNYLPGVAAPNMTVVPSGRQSTLETGFAIANATTGTGSVHIIVDQVGYYIKSNDGGFRFRPLSTPTRILDTRTGKGLSGQFGPASARTLNATSVTTPDSYYVVGNTTGVLPTLNTYLTIWSGENARPTASNLNVTPKRTRAAGTIAPLKFTEGTGVLSFAIYNNAGKMHVLFDAAGTLELVPPTLDTPPPLARTTGTQREVATTTAPGSERFDTRPVRSTSSRY